MSRRIAAAIAVPALVAIAALVGVLALADEQREAESEARAARVQARAELQRARAVAALERGVLAFVVTGRATSLQPYRESLGDARLAPGVDAYIREELEPVIALARRDRREARIRVARGGLRARGERLREAFGRRADAALAAAAAVDARSAERRDDIVLVALAGAGAVLLLALLSAFALSRAARSRLQAGALAARRLEAHRALGAAIVSGGDPGVVLRELADALRADVGALYRRVGEGPFRLVAVRGLDGRQLGDELRPHEGLAGRAVVELRPVAASYDEAALVVPAHGREVPVLHELHLPLPMRGQAVGVATFGRVGSEAFGEADRELAEMLAAHAAPVLAAADAPPREPEVGQVDLVRLTRESVDVARQEAADRGVEVSLALEGVPPCPGDPNRISLALDEVVDSALAAAGAGGRVDVRLFRRADVAVVELAVEPGAGRGLDLARAVFEGHGGAVLVEGPGGGGTAFRVELPLRSLRHA